MNHRFGRQAVGMLCAMLMIAAVVSPAVAVTYPQVEFGPVARGFVTDATSGDPLEGVYILVQMNYYGNYVYASGYSDAAGFYEAIPNVSPYEGDIKITAIADGYQRYSVMDSWDRTTPANHDIALLPGPVAVRAVSGADRFDTAAKCAQLAFPHGGETDVAVVASGRNFPDALGGAALAGALGCPVLLTDTGELPQATYDELLRIGINHVIVVGGESAVSANVYTELYEMNDTTVERIEGGNRYETSRLIAERTVAERGAEYDGRVMFATGTNFPDALAAAPLAAAQGTPILLVKPDEIPADTAAALAAIAPSTGVVLGGTGAVSDEVFDELASEFGPGGLSRIAGTSRYETAAKVAKLGVDEYGLEWDGVAFATGLNFPDALAGGAVQGITGSVLMLTKPTSLETPPKTALQTNAEVIRQVRYFGGTNAIGNAVRTEIQAIIDAVWLTP